MPQPAIGQGLFLAELIKYYHEYRTKYLNWSANSQPDTTAAVLNYQRAMLAWYEARIRREQPYTGNVYHFIQVAATHYAGKDVTAEGNWQAANLAGSLAQDPLLYLPHPISLNDTQKLMSHQFRELGQNCRELLLLAYYHRLSDARLSEVLEIGGAAQAASKRSKCLLMVRERWQHTDLMDVIDVATPEQHELIDRYYRHELEVSDRWEVESLRSTDPRFLEAMSLREDWEDCLLIAGRQDTLTTIQREEEEYRQVKEVPKVRKRRKIKAPAINLPKDLMSYVVIALVAVLGWLLYTTFLGGNKEERLFHTYFKPYPSLVATSNGGAAVDPDLSDMLRYYDRGDYLTAYDELLPAASAYPSAPLYLGVSALALEQPQRALDWFDQYMPTDAYRPYADWYAALAYLSMGRRPAALSILVEIAGTTGHPYELAAAGLIEELE